MQFKMNSLLLSTCIFFGITVGTMPALSQETTSVEPDKKSSSTRPLKVGLALGGGGARGAAHVTVLKVLEENGIPIDCIAGTSIGSVVGGMYAAGVPVKDIEHKFVDSSLMKSFMTVPLGVRVLVAPVMLLPRLWSHPYDGLYRGNKFRNYLNDSLPCSQRNIEDLKIPFSAVVLSLIDGKPHRISQGNLGYAMQASAAVPGLRKPVEINGNLYVDGGVTANVPVQQCREMGADIVIAVCIDERFQAEPLSDFRKVGSVTRRMVKWDLYDMDQRLMSNADIIIHPNVDGISLISTKKCDAEKGLKAGEIAAKAAIPEIKRKLQEAGLSVAGIVNPQ